MDEKEIVVSPEECLEMLECFYKHDDMALAHRDYTKSHLYISFNVFESIVMELLRETQNEEDSKEDVKPLAEIIDLTDDDIVENPVEVLEDIIKEDFTHLDPEGKLKLDPIVYTTKLDDMPLFNQEAYLKNTQKQNIIYRIISHSKPKLDLNECKPNKIGENIKKYNKMVDKLKFIFEGISVDQNHSINHDHGLLANSSYVQKMESDDLILNTCKPLSIIVEDFMKSQKLLADLKRKGIKISTECSNPKQPLRLDNTPENISRTTTNIEMPKLFINFRNKYWLFCNKTNKKNVNEVTWDLYFVNDAGNVNYILVNQDQQQKTDIITPQCNAKGFITTNVCCWFYRKKFLFSMNTSNVITLKAVDSMSKLHSCTQCDCCCSNNNELPIEEHPLKTLAVEMAPSKKKRKRKNDSITPYTEILKRLADLCDGTSLIETALKFYDPPSEPPRENIKLEGDIKFFRSEKNISNLPLINLNICQLPDGKKTITKTPKQINLQKRIGAVVDLETETPQLIPRHVPTNQPNFAPSQYVNIRPKILEPQKTHELPAIQKKTTSSQSIPVPLQFNYTPLQPILTSLPTILNTAQPIRIKPGPLQTKPHPLKPMPIPLQPTLQPVTVTVPQNIYCQSTVNTNNFTVKTIVQTILETFQNVRLSIDDNNKVVAILPKPVEHLTTAELKILRHVLNITEKQVQELNLNPGAELRTNINLINDAQVFNNITAATNVDGSVSVAFNATVNTQDKSTLPVVEPVQESIVEYDDVMIVPKIENVFSLHEPFKCIKQDLSENPSTSIEKDPLAEEMSNVLNVGHYLQVEDVQDNNDVEMCRIEDDHNGRKRKSPSPTPNGQGKIRLVSPSKLGIPQEKPRSESFVQPNIMIIPPSTLYSFLNSSSSTFNNQFLINNQSQEKPSPVAIAPAAPVILNHQIDSSSLRKTSGPITYRNTRVVSIDRKGDIIKGIRHKKGI